MEIKLAYWYLVEFPEVLCSFRLELLDVIKRELKTSEEDVFDQKFKNDMIFTRILRHDGNIENHVHCFKLYQRTDIFNGIVPQANMYGR